MARVGETKCWNTRCNCADASVDRTTGGALVIACHKCRVRVDGKVGTKAFRDIEAVTRFDQADAPGAPPAATAKPAPPAAGGSSMLLG